MYLPDPVLAHENISSPFNINGIAADCIGVACVNSTSFIAYLL